MIILPYQAWLLQFPPVLPKLYWGTVSQEQRIAEICKKVHCIEGYLKYLSDNVVGLQEEIVAEVARLIEESNQRVEEAIDEMRDETTEAIQELRDWVQDQTFSVTQWDVTRGLRTDSVDAMRRTFFDVTVFGTTVDQLASTSIYPTVDALAQSGWNCRALAVIGARVLDHVADDGPWTVSGGGGGGEGRIFDPVDLSEAIVNEDGFVIVGGA